jgi:hypothetical protein
MNLISQRLRKGILQHLFCLFNPHHQKRCQKVNMRLISSEKNIEHKSIEKGARKMVSLV